MIRIKKSNHPPFDLCPVCGKPDGCLLAEDASAAICLRISAGSKKKVGTSGAGWLHILSDKPLTDRKFRVNKPVEVPPKIGFMTKYAMIYHRNFADLKNSSREPVPEVVKISKLGVSLEALDLLLMGYDNTNYTFPMKNGKERIIGIRLRSDRGKFSVRGSQNGLFWPVGIKADSKELLFICEGPTDCAALLDLGFSVIGRASCNTGLKYIKEAFEHFDRQVIIMADKDEPKFRPGSTEPFYPGFEGVNRAS